MASVRMTIFVAALSAGLVGCPKRVTPELQGKNAPTTGEALRRRVERAQAQVSSLKGDAKLSIESPDGSGSTTLFVAADEVGRIHIEQVDFFGKPQSVMVVSEGRFALFDVEKNTFYQGTATARVLERFVRLALEPREMNELLLGRAPLIDGQPSMSVNLGLQTWQLSIRGASAGVSELVQVDPETERVVRATVDRGGRTVELSFGDFSEQQGVRLPERVSYEEAAQRTRATLAFKSVVLNRTLESDLFVLEAPKGAQVVSVDSMP